MLILVDILVGSKQGHLQPGDDKPSMKVFVTFGLSFVVMDVLLALM